MGNVFRAKNVASAAFSTLDQMGQKKYTTDFGGVTSSPLDLELTCHMVGTANETAMGLLMDDTETPTCTASGLDITVNFGSHITNDITTITADPTDDKYALVCLFVDDATGDPEVLVFTKTTGSEYSDAPAGKTLGAHVKEYSLVPAGTALVEINDFIGEE